MTGAAAAAAVPQRAASSSSSSATVSFRTKAATTVAVFVGGPSFAYYWKVVRPRSRYEAHLAALNAIPRPQRQTKLFMGGSEPMRSLDHAARSLRVDLPLIGKHGSGWARLVPFYMHVMWRITILVCRAVPVLAKYAAARWNLFGVTSNDAHKSLQRLLTRMGPSFIKLGQWAATRPDVFPPELCDQLSTLFDQAPPHPWAATEETLRKAGILSKLRDVSKSPLKSGSIAQVHHAVLAEDYTVSRKDTDPGTLAALTFGEASSKSRRSTTETDTTTGKDDDRVVICKAGTPLVLKVLHPGVREQILADSVALQTIGTVLTKLLPGSEFLSLRQTAEEVCALAVSQLNLLREADNLIDFRFNFRRGLYDETEGKVFFPTPLVGLSREDILVETFEVGETLSDANHRHYASMGKVAMDMFMRMLFEHNLVHADLHPGNILFRMVEPDGSYAVADKAKRGSKPQLVILDPGLVTSLSESERKNFISLFAAVASGDGDLGAELMYENAPPPRLCEDLDKFKTDMRRVFDSISPLQLRSFSFAGISIGEKLTDVMAVMRENKVRIDMNFATLVSSVLVGEGMGKRLEPDFNLIESALPFLIKCLKSHELEYLVAKVQETYLTVNN